MATKNRFYAVVVGRGAPCIVDSHTDYLARTRNYPSAQGKGFSSREKAAEYLKAECGCNESLADSLAGDVVYVDGSFNSSTKSYGSAFVHLRDGKLSWAYCSEPIHDNQFSKYENVTGEILATISAISHCVHKGVSEVTVVYDFEGIYNWLLADYKTNNPLVLLYREFIASVSGLIILKFKKVKSHSGDYWNDVVNNLARKASGVD